MSPSRTLMVFTCRGEGCSYMMRLGEKKRKRAQLYWKSIANKECRPQGKQKLPRETIQLHMYQGSRCFLPSIVAQPPPSLLYCPRPTSHHPSILTMDYTSYPRSTYFCHYQFNALLVIRYSFILSTCPSHLNLYSLTPFLFQLSYSTLHS